MGESFYINSRQHFGDMAETWTANQALPVSYPWFRREVWQPAKGGYSHVGWKLSGIVEPVGGPLQRDPAPEGMPPPEQADRPGA